MRLTEPKKIYLETLVSTSDAQDERLPDVYWERIIGTLADVLQKEPIEDPYTIGEVMSSREDRSVLSAAPDGPVLRVSIEFVPKGWYAAQWHKAKESSQ